MENRRLLMAALLSAAVLILWNVAFPPPPPARAPNPGQVAGAEVAPPPAAEDDGEPGGAAEALAAPEVPVEAREPIVASVEERVELRTDRMVATFSNRGAQLISVRLLDQLDREGEPVELVRLRGLDPYPLALLSPTGGSHPLNSALWEAESTPATGLVFRHRSPAGEAEKSFRVDPDGLLEVAIRVEGAPGWGVLLGPGLRQLDGTDPGDQWIQREASYSRGEESDEFQPGKLDEPVRIPAAGLRWVALEDNHFLSALLPRSGVGEAWVRPVWQREELEPERARFLAVESDDAPEGTVPALMVVLGAAEPEVRLEAFFGAKQYDRLATLDRGLEETVRWGMIGWLSRPLYFGLEWLYDRVIPNYGWAIVLLTLGIKLVFFPLTWKSQESMTKMQELNPKVQAIRARYRPKLKDKQGRPNLEAQRQMNEEVMTLYRSAGVNPVSGCFPMLLQIPVFFALYRLLATAVELRNAPWIAWIRDLSAPDPIYLLPIVMGATSLGMQKMMPSSGDPMQRRIMQMMPIMFTVFAFAFPAGLVLYWLTNNLLTMGQQAILLKVRARREGGDDERQRKAEVR